MLRKYSGKTIAMDLVQELEAYGGDPANIVTSRMSVEMTIISFANFLQERSPNRPHPTLLDQLFLTPHRLTTPEKTLWHQAKTKFLMPQKLIPFRRKSQTTRPAICHRQIVGNQPLKIAPNLRCLLIATARQWPDLS